MDLAIDIGNTRMKLGLFKGKELLVHDNLKASDLEGLKEFVKGKSIENAILSSTATVPKKLENYLNEKYKYIRLETKTAVPMGSIYATPETLGKDRVAGVMGASVLFPGHGCLVIDAGTCITYDLINAKTVYLGGNIAPGISMRLKAMDEFTSALPLVSKQHPETDRGYSTETAIRAGAVWGAAQESLGFIQRFDKQTEDLKVILTGGDAELLDDLIDWGTVVEPHLVLIGLIKILEHNVA